jgi:hypothetical protein
MVRTLLRSFYLLLILFATAVNGLHAQSFVSAGNMIKSRVGHTSTLLQDGRVLITGGRSNTSSTDPSWTFWSSAEIYDPVSGVFSETGAMTDARAWHQAVLLRDGRVFVVGGYTTQHFNTSADAELYDPTTGVFTSAGQMSVAQQVYSAVLLKNGKVLVSGARTSELFDPATGAFTAVNVLNGSVGLSLLSDGEVLLAPAYSALAVYDPANNGLVQLPVSWGTQMATATPLLDGAVLLAGGATDGYGEAATSKAAVYDTATQTLIPRADLALARDSHTATLLKDGSVLIAGGYNGDGTDDITGIFSEAELYDAVTGTFSTIGSMLMHRDGHAATLLRDGRVLITGGRASTSRWPPDPLNSSAELFIPESTQGTVPQLTLDSSHYCVGDSWRLRAEPLAPQTSVQMSGIGDGTPWTVPNWSTSGPDGALVLTGTFGADAVGDYTLWLYAGGKVSNSVSIKIETCSVP